MGDLNDLTSKLAPFVMEFLEFLKEKWGIRDPVKVLKECIRHREWFKGVVLSTAFFEGIGREVLISHFKDKINSKRIEHLH